jgi:hypothetical protein
MCVYMCVCVCMCVCVQTARVRRRRQLRVLFKRLPVLLPIYIHM